MIVNDDEYLLGRSPLPLALRVGPRHHHLHAACHTQFSQDWSKPLEKAFEAAAGTNTAKITVTKCRIFDTRDSFYRPYAGYTSIDSTFGGGMFNPTSPKASGRRSLRPTRASWKDVSTEFLNAFFAVSLDGKQRSSRRLAS